MDALKELKKVLEEQIEEITKKKDISPTELERLDKAVDIIKDIETICAMKEYGQSGEGEEYNYSNRYPMYMREGGNSRTGGYSGNRYYMDRGSYSYEPMMDGNSYRRSRDMMPNRYMSREPYYDGGYSGHGNKEDLKMDLRMMMDNAKSDKERIAIQQLLEQWKD